MFRAIGADDNSDPSFARRSGSEGDRSRSEVVRRKGAPQCSRREGARRLAEGWEETEVWRVMFAGREELTRAIAGLGSRG